MENLKHKTFKVEIDKNIEYVCLIDKFRSGNSDMYLVVVCGERAKSYANGKRYREIMCKDEIITPNMGKVYCIYPSQIIEVSNYA